MNRSDPVNQIADSLNAGLNISPTPKSAAVLEVKPFDEDTDVKKVESLVRGIRMDGLQWRESRIVHIGFNLTKLKICCILEDLKVHVESLMDRIMHTYPEYIQSVDCFSNMDITLCSINN